MKKYLIGAMAGISVLSLVGCSTDKPKDITIYTRDIHSGTRDGFFTAISFKEAVKDNSVLKSGVSEVSGNGDMITKIANDKYGIGYISLGTLSSNKNIKGLDFNGVKANEDNVLNGKYGLTRNFNYVIGSEGVTNNGELTSVGELVYSYQTYMKSYDGVQLIKNKHGIVDVEEDGLFAWDTLRGKDIDDPQKENADPIMLKIQANIDTNQDYYKNVTLNIGGSTSVTGITETINAIIKDWSKCQIDADHSGSSDAIKKTYGVEKGKIHIGFASREFTQEEIALVTNKDNLGVMSIDAIVAIVNKDNKVSNLTTEQLKKIYSGEIPKWSDIE
ncbi:MAG: substrate-binding domain-containing protein [Anaeroplasmataceae bacterium]